MKKPLRYSRIDFDYEIAHFLFYVKCSSKQKKRRERIAERMRNLHFSHEIYSTQLNFLLELHNENILL